MAAKLWAGKNHVMLINCIMTVMHLNQNQCMDTYTTQIFSTAFKSLSLFFLLVSVSILQDVGGLPADQGLLLPLGDRSEC